MEQEHLVHRLDAYEQLNRTIVDLHAVLEQLEDAVNSLEAVDAGKFPDPTRHTAALAHLSTVCRHWQGTMIQVRDGFSAWMTAVAQEQQEAASGMDFLRTVTADERS